MACIIPTGPDLPMVPIRHFVFSLVQFRLISLQDELMKWLLSNVSDCWVCSKMPFSATAGLP